MHGARQRGYKQPKVTSSYTGRILKMNRGKGFFRGGVGLDLLLLIVFLVLAYVFIARRSSKGDLNDEVGRVKSESKNMEGSLEHMVDERINKLPDFRSLECKNMKYKVNKQVSIVAVFFDYSFHDLKITLNSVVRNTPKELIKEILVIDDASTLDYIIDKSEEFIKTISKAKLIRNQNQLWTSGARTRGFQEASSDIVVFLDSNTVVAHGWLEPLISTLEKESDAIVVPHYDSIKDPVSYEYLQTKDSLISSLSWSFSLRMTTTVEKVDASGSLKSPTLRGNAFAIKRNSFLKIGAYDEGFQDGGGCDLELSIRAWLCGSRILVSPCSRVGIVNLQDPVKIVTHSNIRRVAELWFSGRKSLVFRNTGVTDAMNQAEHDSFTARKDQLAKMNLQCKDIDWYFQNVAGHLPTPSEKAVKFGMVKCKTGRCMRIGEDKRVDLGQCQPEHYGVPHADMVIEFTEDGLITNNGQCLTVKQTAYVMLEDCVQGDNKQKFHFKDGRFLNEWSQYCLMHVTDPDKETGKQRQIAMAQECGSAPNKEFATFEFVTF